MMDLDEIEQQILREVAGIDGRPEGAYNFRLNGKSVGRQSSTNIEVSTSPDGLNIHVAPHTHGEVVHIPVIISASGLTELVRNNFYIGQDCEVTIVAGCGIYNCGTKDSVHDGVHSFYVGKNSRVRYIEKHYGAGPGAGKILNPVTRVEQEPGSYVEIQTEQLRGVDSTRRETSALLANDAKILIRERLLTHGRQDAESTIRVELAGRNSVADIVSRSVAQDESRQLFRSQITGKNACRGHSECDAIIMNKAQVSAIPSLDAQCPDAELIHEAAIGKIAGEQITKLMSLGLSRAQAESQIVNGFLR